MESKYERKWKELEERLPLAIVGYKVKSQMAKDKVEKLVADSVVEALEGVLEFMGEL